MPRLPRSTPSRTSSRGPRCRVAAPLQIGGETLLRFRDFRFSAFPFLRGRAPELDAPEARQLLGRSIARLHQIGATRAFAHRLRIGVERLGWEARAQVLAADLLPERLHERYASVSGALLERVTGAFAEARGRAPTSGCTGTVIWEICCGTSTGRCSSTSMTAPRVRGCRICG